MIVAAKSGIPIIGQVADVMGWIMNGIYWLLSRVGIQNLGLCIIIFSIIIYALMTPLQIQQQKFSKLSAIMQPELQKVQNKYKGKKDQESMQKMQDETQAIYQKYGVSPSGSCVQILIQFPVLMALWQVIYRIPSYVSSVANIFTEAVDKIITVNGATEILQNFIADNKMTRVSLVMDEAGVVTKSSIVDFLYALSSDQWKSFADIKEFSGFSNVIEKTAGDIRPLQNFLGLNIADQPLTYIKSIATTGITLVAIAAVLVPVLAWFTQWMNYKLMPQAAGGNDESAVMNSMKTMNTVMPIMSAFFCLSFPVGLGIYWIASALVRSVQQVLINRHMNKIDIDDLINENLKKMEKKRAKKGLPPQKITNQAHQNVKNINTTTINKGNSGEENQMNNAKKIEQAYSMAKNAKAGSIAAKANMVRDYDERNKKK